MKILSLNRQSLIEAYNFDDKKFDYVSLKNLIEETFGESNDLDFKRDLISEEKLAKTILAMANAGGGAIICGISDDNKIVGIQKENIKDQTELDKKLHSFLPNNIDVSLQVLDYPEDKEYKDFQGKIFYVFYVNKQYRYAPFLAKKDGDKIYKNIIYIRKNAANETASNEDLEDIFQKRLLAQYEDLSNLSLNDHIVQLKELYDHIQKRRSTFAPGMASMVSIGKTLGNLFEVVESEHYPSMEFDEFITMCIEKKQMKIEHILEIYELDN